MRATKEEDLRIVYQVLHPKTGETSNK
jgi:hypothetical protein